MICFLPRASNILPKKKLHLSVWVYLRLGNLLVWFLAIPKLLLEWYSNRILWDSDCTSYGFALLLDLTKPLIQHQNLNKDHMARVRASDPYCEVAIPRLGLQPPSIASQALKLGFYATRWLQIAQSSAYSYMYFEPQRNQLFTSLEPPQG